MGKKCSVDGLDYVCVWGDDIGGDYSWIWEEFDINTNMGSVNKEYPKYEIKLKRYGIPTSSNRKTEKDDIIHTLMVRSIVGDGEFGEWDEFSIKKTNISTLDDMISECEVLMKWYKTDIDNITGTVY